MKIHFQLTDPRGIVLASGRDSAHTADLGSWDNHRSVVRHLHTGGVTARLGQKLTMWVEDDHPAPIFPDETLDRAAEAFHRAVGPYLHTVGSAGSTCSRGDDLVDAPVTEVVEALLCAGWIPPSGEAEEPEEPEPVPEPRAAL